LSEPTGSAPRRPLVLVADDDAQVRASLGALLRADGYEVGEAEDGVACVRLVRELQPAVLVLDLSMPGRDGFGVLDELPHLDLDTELPDVVVLTGHAGAADGVRAVRAGAIGFLMKPCRPLELLTVIRRSVDAREATAHKRKLFRDSHKTWTCRVTPNRANVRWVAQQLAVEMQAFVFDGDIRPRRLIIALDEALSNAVIHGALGVDSSLKEIPHQFETTVSEREKDPEWSSRLVTVASDFRPDRLEVCISDPGEGFDVASLPDPDDPEALLKSHGRGILIMRALVDDLVFEDGGRRVRLVQSSLHAEA
jgi:CheY-like chemotaxis protein/anti-sigma regulatory factor (Ser/Thr protein kinase)